MKLFSIYSLLRSRPSSLHPNIQSQLLSTHQIPKKSSPKGSTSLLSRLLPVVDPNASVVGVLDQWIKEGKKTSKLELREITRELSARKRFKQAFEVSVWMTNKRGIAITAYDVGVRLKLINEVCGLEQAEDYFSKIPESLKSCQVLLALLNCYSIAQSVDKAETVMQKARDLGYVKYPIWYNLLMNVHCKLGDTVKLDALLTEMESKRICQDVFTYSIRLKACAEASDVAGMDKVMASMESSPGSIHWKTYLIAAKGYLKMELYDKALAIINRLEEQLRVSKKLYVMSGCLLDLYTGAAKKEDVYRIWNLHKKHGNKGYIDMMRSLMKLDDIEGAEKILGEWESRAVRIDFRVPNFLIDFYCENGRLEEAEALIAKGMSKGGTPVVWTWLYMATGYLQKDEVPKGIEALKEAISVCPPNYSSLKDSMTTCLEYLEGGNGTEKAKELVMCIRQRIFYWEPVPDEMSSVMKDADPMRFQMRMPSLVL